MLPILDTFKDFRGKYDGKRITAFGCALYVFSSAFGNLFFGLEPSDYIFYAMLGTLLTLFGLSLPEYINKGKTKIEPIIEETPQSKETEVC